MDYRVKSIDEKTWQIEEYDEHNSVYMYLLEGEKKALLIDAGFGTIPLDKIVASLTKLPVEVFLTHGHIDHIGGAALFDVVYMHRADEGVYNLHAGKSFQQAHSQNGGDIFKAHDHVILCDAPYEIDLGGRHLTVVHVPGHTKGSVCLRDEERRWMFTGDTCCKADVLLNLDFSDTVEVYLHAVRELKKEMRSVITTWPAHHTNPVSPDIVDEFEEAADMICKGEVEGELKQHSFGPARYFKWKNIGIWY